VESQRVQDPSVARIVPKMVVLHAPQSFDDFGREAEILVAMLRTRELDQRHMAVAIIAARDLKCQLASPHSGGLRSPQEAPS
jgi:hypothetical protein